MGFNIHTLSVTNRSTNLADHAALAASFNPHPRFEPKTACLPYDFSRREGEKEPLGEGGRALISGEGRIGMVLTI
jgi:hypothetical protein